MTLDSEGVKGWGWKSIVQHSQIIKYIFKKKEDTTQPSSDVTNKYYNVTFLSLLLKIYFFLP